MSKKTYHDIVVWVDGKPYRISDSYGYSLECTRVAGWRLWWKPIGAKESALIGGEYDSDEFKIIAGNQKVCG